MGRFLTGAALLVIACSHVQQAQAQLTQISVPSGDLKQALISLGRQSGLQLIYRSEDVRGKTTSGVKGTLSVDAALNAVLKGTGLSAHRDASGGVAIVNTPPRLQPAAQKPVAQPQSYTEQARFSDEPVTLPDTQDIVVTAQGRTESLQNVPLSVSVIGGEALQKSGIRNLDDLSSRVSNVKITSAVGADLLNIRGVGSGLSPNFEQSVSTFVDGVYRGRSRAMRAAMFDIDRIEVLKGPQTTFFGNNAIAGAFNITTRKPDQDFSYNVTGLFGTYGKYSLEAGVTAPLTETLSIRAAAKAYGQDGYVFNNYTDDYGPRQRDWIGRVSLLWEPTSNFTSYIRVDRGQMRDTESSPFELQNCPPDNLTPRGSCLRYLNQAGGPVDDTLNLEMNAAPSKYSYDFIELAWKNDLKLGDFTLSSTTGYFDHEVASFINTSPVPVRGVGGTEALLPASLLEKYNSFSQEIRLISPADRAFSYLVGLYYSSGELDTDNFGGAFFAPFGASVAPLYSASDPIANRFGMNQRDTVKSAFASATWKVTDSLRINGGLRYSIVKKKADRFLQTGRVNGTSFPTPDNFEPGTPAQQAALNALLGYDNLDFANPSRTDKKLMPTVSIQYDVVPGLMTYASYTKGFKAGGFDGGTFVTPSFAPETVNAYEIGLKGKLFDNSLTFNLAAFLNDYKDLQESANFQLPNGIQQSRILNAATMRSKGVELNTNWKLSDALRFQADVAYLDSKYLSFPNAPCTDVQLLAQPTGCVQNLAGKPRPFAPKWSGSASMTYSQPLGSGVVTASPTVRFSSRYVQQVNNNPLYYQEGYAKLDLRLAYGSQDGRWELAVLGTNLNDRLTGSFRTNVATATGTYYVLPEEGRAVAVQFSIRN